MADKLSIPAPPWMVENLGEEKYCELAVAFNIFNPKSEAASYRPPLDLTVQYREQEAAKPKGNNKAQAEQGV